MNYCDKIHYRIYTTGLAEFDSMVDDLLRCLPQGEAVLRLVFFGKPTDNDEYVVYRDKLESKVKQFYGTGGEPAVSFVSQPVLNGGLAMEVHSYKVSEGDVVAYRKRNGYPYAILENMDGRFLFCGGFHGDVQNMDIQLQAIEAFRLAMEILDKEGFAIGNIIRQWNYIERITDFDGVDQHYQMFNNVRSNFYKSADWHTGYPAATGIGTDLGGVLVDMDVAVFHHPECFASAIDNKLQVAAHAYSDEVLEVAQERKSTPKFERAKSVTFNDRQLIYISGTAAIRGEKSMTGVDIERQFHITMENIEQLISGAQLNMLRVYLKHPSDYGVVVDLLKKAGLSIPISYLRADVCREELLIEIEGIASK